MTSRCFRFAVLCGLALGAIGCRCASSAASNEVSELRDGDVIFQESSSRQSDMVRVLTRSRWTHLGVVFREKHGYVVLEAVSPVRRTPLPAFIARGREQRYVVKRLRDASALDSDELRSVAASFVGRPYDLKFRWDDETLYCSELVHKLFERAASIHLGKIQRADEMNLKDARVQQALKQRFQGAAFDPAERVVTPDSIFNDAQLEQVFP